MRHLLTIVTLLLFPTLARAQIIWPPPIVLLSNISDDATAGKHLASGGAGDPAWEWNSSLDASDGDPADAFAIDATGNATLATAAASLKLPLQNDLLTPTLCFSDCDSGIAELADDGLTFIFNQNRSFSVGPVYLAGDWAQSGAVANQNATATVPTLIPNASDLDTGIGGTAATVSLIANGTEIVRATTTGAQVNGLLNLVGTTASEVALKRSGTEIHARLGDDSGYANTIGAYVKAASDFQHVGGAAATASTGTQLTWSASNANILHSQVTRVSWTNANITACGAVKTCDRIVGRLSAKTIVRAAYIVVVTADTGATSDLTMSLGRTGAAYEDWILDSDLKAAANTVYGDAHAERGTELDDYTGDLPSFAATTDIYVQINTTDVDAGDNLDDVLTSTGYIYLLTETLP